jgi:hypothetical protein
MSFKPATTLTPTDKMMIAHRIVLGAMCKYVLYNMIISLFCSKPWPIESMGMQLAILIMTCENIIRKQSKVLAGEDSTACFMLYQTHYLMRFMYMTALILYSFWVCLHW